MLVPVVVHWLDPPPTTVKFPDASTFNLVLSYFNNIVFDVFDKGFEKVKLFCFVDNAVLIPNTDKPEVFISPTTFNDDLIVVLFNDVNPDTFNDDNNVVLLFKVVVPDTFNHRW